jgi:hypothetical protein
MWAVVKLTKQLFPLKNTNQSRTPQPITLTTKTTPFSFQKGIGRVGNNSQKPLS